MVTIVCDYIRVFKDLIHAESQVFLLVYIRVKVLEMRPTLDISQVNSDLHSKHDAF